jgi:hypothetical protein
MTKEKKGIVNTMKLNVKLEINPGTIVEMADQLPTRDFFRVRKLIETKARMRFKNSMLKARGEFQKSGLKRKDLESLLAEVRGKKR